MKRAIRATLLAAMVLPAAVPGALAHGGNPDYRSVIDRVNPSVDGVTFQVLSYDSYLQVLDRNGHEVTIYGYEQEPYARILPDGTVQVNQRSPATYLNDSPFPDIQVPAIADPAAAPRWKTVDDSGTFVWHDHRIHYQSTATPPQVTDEGRRTKVLDFEVPIRVDGRRGAVEGTLFWVGSPEGSKLPFALAGIAIVFGGGALVLLVRRGRGDGEPGGPAEEAW